MKKHYLLLILLFSLTITNAQNPTDLNPNFDTKDYLPNIPLYTNEFALQSDGKVVVIGNPCSYKLYNDQQLSGKNGIIRLNSDLSIDDTFETGVGFDLIPQSVAIQSDDKILVSGYFNSYNGNPVKKIIRLNEDGSIDTTFNLSSAGFNTAAVTNISLIKILPDDKIMICGKFDFKINQKFYGRNLVRLNTDGTVDKTFQPGTGFPYTMFKFEIQPDDKIVRVYENTYNNETSYKIDRLNPNGDIDLSFNAIEGFGTVRPATTVGYTDMFDCQVGIQEDGKILFGGCFYKFQYGNTSGLIRFNSDGTKDSSFNYTVPGYPAATVKQFIILPNNKILNLNLSLINEDGTSDNMPIANLDLNSSSNKILLNSANKLLIYTENALRVDNTEIISNNFVQLDLTTNEINKNLQLSTYFEGKDILQNVNEDIIILGNSKNNFNIKYHDGIKLLNKNGALIQNNNLYNNLFNGTQSNSNSFKKGLIQPDGKIIVLKHINPSTNSIIRFNSDFSLDPTFSCSLSDDFATIALQADGKIVVASNSQTKIYRLNSDGSLDNSFLPNLPEIGFNEGIYTLAVQKDTKILVAGAFSSYNGVKTNKILRLNSDGSIDTTFQSQVPLGGYIYSLGLQSDGKIVIGGENLGWENNDYVALKRLNIDGTLDNTFNSYFTKTGHYIRKIIIEPNNKILFFTNINNDYIQYDTNELKRLESNGTVDPTFDIGDGFDGNINSIFRQKDGGILVTGGFTKYRNDWSNGTVLLNGENTSLNTQNFTYNNLNAIIVYPNPVKDFFNVSLKDNSQVNSVKIYNILGELVVNHFDKNGISTLNVSNLNKGVYSIILNSNKKLSSKFIKL